MKVYVACGLTHVPSENFADYVETIHQIAAEVLACVPGAEVKYALVNSDPQLAERSAEDRAKLCYIWDRRMVEEADLVIAEASFPSTGLGIELQIAEMHGTPAVLLFRDFGHNRADHRSYKNPGDTGTHDLQIGEGFVTLMALGLPNIFKVIQYDSREDCRKLISEAITLLSNE
ncbi:hypothetical protein [Rhizobium leguminosarum]